MGRISVWDTSKDVSKKGNNVGKVNIYFDGGVHGKRVCIYDQSNNKYLVKTITDAKTNNELEYWALIMSLRYARRIYKEGDVIFNGDSSLVINQVWGSWRINKERLRILMIIVNKELDKCKFNVSARWTRRNKNFAGIHLEKLMKSDKK